MRTKSMTLLLVVLMALPSLAWAGRGRGRRHGMGPPPQVMKKFLKDAGLSDQQIGKIEALHFAADKQAIDIRSDIQKQRLELQRLMGADKPNRTAIFSQLEKISALQLKLKKNRVGLLLDVRGQMTPEQFEKLQQFQFEWRARHRGMRGGPGKPGCPGGPGCHGGPGGPGFPGF